MPYSAKEAQKIVLRAKRALGQMQKQSASDKRIFMRNCIDQMTSDDDTDEDDARDICEQLWEEGDTSQFEE
jgi:hypothetical protein